MAKIQFMRQELESLGSEQLIDRDSSSCTLTTSKVPEGMKQRQFSEAIEKEGFLIYRCKGELAEDYFQVSAMGETSMQDLENFIRACKKVCG